MDEKALDHGVTKAGKPRKRPARPGEGGPTLYDPKYCKEIVDFFSVPPFFEREIVHTNSKSGSEWTEIKQVPNPPRFVAQFARKIGVSKVTIYKWAKDYPEFANALTRAQELREEMFVVNGSMNLYNPAFAMFYLKNRYEARYKDKTEIDKKEKLEVTYREEHVRVLNKAREILQAHKRIPESAPLN